MISQSGFLDAAKQKKLVPPSALAHLLRLNLTQHFSPTLYYFWTPNGKVEHFGTLLHFQIAHAT